MRTPAVSVAICAYNSMRYIDETLQSVFAQTFQDLEIVIVDDGSTDGTPDYIEREYRDPRITVVRQRNQTLRVARPMAAAQATGEFIAFLDHDDVWLPNKLEMQMEVARASPGAALIFSDCFIIDAAGRITARLSDHYDFDEIDLTGPRAHLELLRRGCFVGYSTAVVRSSAFRAVGGFNETYQYVSDYDLWLRLARRYELKCIREPLAKYRVYETQFTQRSPDITLAEHIALLMPIVRSDSYPGDVRIALRDNVFGQHRVAFRLLWRQQRFKAAIRAVLGMYRYPSAIHDYCRGRIATSPIGPAMQRALLGYHWCKRLKARVAARASKEARRVWVRGRRAPARLARIVRGDEPLLRKAGSRASDQPVASTPTHVWVDGTSLGRAQTGYFNLLSELIRQIAQRELVVHVRTTRSGRAALLERMAADGAAIRFHPIGWRSVHWSQIHDLLFGWHAQLPVTLIAVLLMTLGVARGSPIAIIGAMALGAIQAAVCLDEIRSRYIEACGRSRQRLTKRVARFFWRRFPAPRWKAATPNVVELLFWRGRFRWRNSLRIAIVQDMTTRIHPELHTDGNIAEFEEFLGYVQRHAHTIATVSEQSRRDITAGIAVNPDSVFTIPMPVHPQYARPSFSERFVRCHGINTPYVLCVGAIEPRKNLRRLLNAFDLLKEEAAAKELALVLAGPTAWDPAFTRFLTESEIYRRVRLLGFVPLEHLPSLYHLASVVICPSMYEGFGIPVLEAMCSSAIVIASRISSLPEVLGSGGIQFDPFDTHDIATALLGALTLSPSDAAEYRRRCRERAEQHLERVAAADPVCFVETAVPAGT